jgi:hypothetical protein
MERTACEDGYQMTFGFWPNDPKETEFKDIDYQFENSFLALLPPQEKTFSDPQGHYTLEIPPGLEYKYEKNLTTLSLWTPKEWSNMVSATLSRTFPYLVDAMTIDYTPNADKEYEQQPLPEEQVSQVNVDGIPVNIYAPKFSEIDYVEALIPLADGYLKVTKVGNELQEIQEVLGGMHIVR